MNIETHQTEADGHTARVYPPSTGVVAPKTREETAATQTGGAALELIGGAGAVVLGILGLLGDYPAMFAEIGAIAAGGGLLVHGIATAARWRDVSRRAGATNVVSVGIGGEAIAGAGGVVLGILALLGVIPMTLMAISAIAVGAGMLFAAPAQPEIVGEGPNQRVVQAARAGGGIEGIAGAGAIVLGILALVHVGPTITMTLIAMLAVGGGLVLAGGALGAIFTRQTMHPQHV